MRRTTLIVLFLISVYILKLGAEGKLLYYIHPRYVLWALLAAGATLIVVPLAYRYRKSIHTDYPSPSASRVNVIIIVVILAAIFLPATPLQSFTALERFDPGAPAVANISYMLSSPVDPAAQNLTIREWIILLYRQNANLLSYQNRSVDVTGFIYADTDRQFYVMRFVVTCCTADATPVGIPVQYTWSQQFKAGDWVEVKGKISIINQQTSPEAVIVPDSVTAVAQPDIPYIY